MAKLLILSGLLCLLTAVVSSLLPPSHVMTDCEKADLYLEELDQEVRYCRTDACVEYFVERFAVYNILCDTVGKPAVDTEQVEFPETESN